MTQLHDDFKLSATGEGRALLGALCEIIISATSFSAVAWARLDVKPFTIGLYSKKELPKGREAVFVERHWLPYPITTAQQTSDFLWHWLSIVPWEEFSGFDQDTDGSLVRGFVLESEHRVFNDRLLTFSAVALVVSK